MAASGVFLSFDLFVSDGYKPSTGMRIENLPKFRYKCIVASLFLWQHIMYQRDVIVFVDNNSEKDALVSCFSPVHVSDLLLQSCATAEDACDASFWYTRVASEANIADWASRLVFQPLFELGFLRARLQSCVSIAAGLVPRWDDCFQ